MMGLRPGGARQVGGVAGSGAQASGWYNPAIAGDVSAAPATAQATPPPAPRAVDSVLLSAYKQWDSGTSSWLANLSWSGSSGPFTLVTCPYTDFHNMVTTLEKGVTSTGRVCTTDSAKSIECYEVSDGSTASVAVQGLGYEPRPAPTQPSFSNVGYWWNSTVDVSASYLDNIAAENLAHFYDRPMKAESVTASGDFATQATFRIPADARATYLRVEAGGRPSPSSDFLDLVPPGVTFGSINGMCWAPQDGFVYVADGTGGLIKQVDLFKVTPTFANVVTGVTSPMISKVSTGGMFVYVDGMAGATEVFAYTIGAGVSHYAYTTDTNFTRSITPVGIALLPGGSACFIADSSTGRVVKIPAGAGSGSSIVDNWGNYAWSLPVPCGIDADPIGYVNVGTNYGYIAKINTVGNGWTNNGSTYGTVPHAIEVDRDMNNGGSVPLIYSSAAFCEAFNRNAIEGVAGAGGGAAHYVGANVWDTGDGHLSVEPDWGYWVYPHYSQRVVINNNGMTSAQAAYPSANQTQDRIIKITVSGWPSRTLHLKLVDPPDFAPYSPDGGCLQGGCSQSLPYEGNDNQADSGDAYGLTTDANGQSPAPAIEMNLPFGSGDWAKDFYLKVPARYSGDNFRVEVSKVNPISGQVIAQKTVALSSLYTTWKRVLVERDHMFRRGNLLDPTASGGVFAPDTNTDPDTIYLYRWDQTTPKTDETKYVQPGDTIVIFDTDSPYPSGAYETATVVSTDFVDAPVNPANCFPPDCGQLPCQCVSVLAATLDKDLKNSYHASPLDFSSGKSSAVGVIHSADGLIYDTAINQINGTGSAFYDADTRDIKQPFDDAYVEFIFPRDGMGAVPFISNSATNFYVASEGAGSTEPGYTMRRNFQYLWFKNKDKTNYLHALGVRGPDASGSTGVGGFTWPWSLYHFIHVETLSQLQSDPEFLQHLEQAAYDHESGHEFYVNTCSGGHDTRDAWCSTDSGNCNGELCLMDANGGYPLNTVNRFCVDDLEPGDPACGNGLGSIRQKDDLVKSE